MAVSFADFNAVLASCGRDLKVPLRPVVCIQGLGFVGLAMGIAVAAAKDATGAPAYNVVGLDLDTPEGRERIDAVNRGILPFRNSDTKMAAVFREVWEKGLLAGTSDPEAVRLASVALVSINLDLNTAGARPTVHMDGFRAAMQTLGSRLPAGALVVVETTVPPGTCEKIVVPEIADALRRRGMAGDEILVAHSYERVMPGEHYLDSIVNFWRVYSGQTERAADRCRDFLSSVINVAEFPLTRLHSMTASETAKVLENSYRATTIAFIEEWGRFAEAVGINLFEVVDAIRRRPTHSNIRQPGFGVGGYCLTKDPYFAGIGARELFGKEISFPYSERSVEVNNAMPLVTLGLVESQFPGGLKGKKILLLGVSYRQDVGDTRYSPAQLFTESAVARGAAVTACDPLLDRWTETGLAVLKEIPSAEGFDAVVFAIPHREYRHLDVARWLAGAKPLVVDANAVLAPDQFERLKKSGVPVRAVGRGDL